MKNINWQDNRELFLEQLEEIFVEEIWQDDFYRRLIEWVVDHRAPIIYDISDGREHFSFSGAYHWESFRHYQGCPYRQSIFLLHDFTHMLFPYAHDVNQISLQQFIADFVHQERLASSETEIWLYYRLPTVREQVFQDEKIYFDVLAERKFNMPENPADFLQHRHRLVEDEQYGKQHLDDHPDILKFFQQWKTMTPQWVETRYRSMQPRRMPTFAWPRLRADNYWQVISDYRLNDEIGPTIREERNQQYQDNLINNLALAWGLLRWDEKHLPRSIKQIEQQGAVKRLEGEVFWDEIDSARPWSSE